MVELLQTVRELKQSCCTEWSVVNSYLTTWPLTSWKDYHYVINCDVKCDLVFVLMMPLLNETPEWKGKRRSANEDIDIRLTNQNDRQSEC